MPPVMQCPYLPLTVETLFEGRKIPGLEFVRPWRMNLTAVSIRDPQVFYVAVDRQIQVFNVPHPSGTAGSPCVEKLQYNGGPNLDNTVNAIRVGDIGEEEVLVAVDDSGRVYMWFTAHLKRQPLVFQHKESAWGIALHGPKYLLAVSANSHTIMIWDLQSRAFEDDDLMDLKDEEKRCNNESLGGMPERELVGHDHNVPSVDFSSCGTYLASCSIDCTVRIWNVQSGQVVSSRYFNSQWAWTVRFVAPEMFKRIQPKTPDWCDVFKTKGAEVCQEVLRRCGTGIRKASLPAWVSSSTVPMPDDMAEEFEEDPEDRPNSCDDMCFAIGENEHDISVVEGNGDDECSTEPRALPTNVSEMSVEPARSDAIIADTETNNDDVDLGTVDTWSDDDGGDDHHSVDSPSDSTGSTSDGGAMDLSDHHPAAPPPLINDIEDSGSENSGFWEDMNDDDDVGDVGDHVSSYGSENEDESGDDLAMSEESLLYEDPPLMYRPVSWWRQRAYEPPPPAGIAKCGVIKGFPTDFLIYTSVEHMYILDPRTLATCHEHKKLISQYDLRSDLMAAAHDRLIFVEFLPELGVAVVASQKGTAALVRLVRTRDEHSITRFKMETEQFLPRVAQPQYPLLGVFCSKHVDETLPPRYHVHLLYADGHMFSYVVQRSFVVNPLTVDRLRL
ncbi:WD40-repeat-containing domain protein [Powellomyces hirtus]|nr:WD40-repeat-containing domain protein [Powellomyces hirtus]